MSETTAKTSVLPANITAEDLPDGGVTLRRQTRESSIEVTVSFGDRDDSIQSDTGLHFFNHMLEMIAWYAGFNLKATFRTTRFNLAHVVCEDIGVVFGHAIRRILERRISDGVRSDGAGHGGIDDALAFSYFILEGRANHFFDLPDAQWTGDVEDCHNTDLVQFFEGFAQGSKGTLHLRLVAGRDPHHQWEACFRAFARALREALSHDPWRVGATAGVKGTLD
jgi:imidazoleglycerol-phosphate dehydratase